MCVRRYLTHMVRTIRNKPLRHFFETGHSGKLPVKGAAISRVLRTLDAAGKPEEMNLPGFYLGVE